jgi:hypothetical protein
VTGPGNLLASRNSNRWDTAFVREKSNEERRLVGVADRTILYGALCATVARETRSIRVRIIDERSGDDSNSREQTRTLILRGNWRIDARIFSVSVSTLLAFGEDPNSFKSQFDGDQAVILSHDISNSPTALKLMLEQFVTSGGGLLLSAPSATCSQMASQSARIR